ncbi:energy transducer TonB [Aurantiacibacter gilvus]|uniref:TonB family protein n=1 Tax=Aurantiacibacter gilvus TaxID=3139141 RepID=A0ABU9IBL9_9SPHN
MSYVNATVSPATRARSIAGVVGIHALLGAGVVIGLTITNIIVEEDEELISIFVDDEVELPPPPPVETPEPTPVESVITAPEPPIRVPLDNAPPARPTELDLPDSVVRVATPPIIEVPGPVAPPATPLFDPVGPLPTNGPAGWITNADYPRRALMRDMEGTAGYRLVVGSNGRVNDCQITRSTGHSVLDRGTCRQLESRARFEPAKNNRGDVVVGTYTGQVTWQIPD